MEKDIVGDGRCKDVVFVQNLDGKNIKAHQGRYYGLCDGGDGSGGFGVRVRVRDSGCQCFR